MNILWLPWGLVPAWATSKDRKLCPGNQWTQLWNTDDQTEEATSIKIQPRSNDCFQHPFQDVQWLGLYKALRFSATCLSFKRLDLLLSSLEKVQSFLDFTINWRIRIQREYQSRITLPLVQREKILLLGAEGMRSLCLQISNRETGKVKHTGLSLYLFSTQKAGDLCYLQGQATPGSHSL